MKRLFYPPFTSFCVKPRLRSRNGVHSGDELQPQSPVGLVSICSVIFFAVAVFFEGYVGGHSENRAIASESTVTAQTTQNEVSSPKKSLVIMLDGMRSDVLFTAPTPNVDSLLDGSWAGKDTEYYATWTFQAHTNLDADPSSATNHVAIITGVTATKNNVYQNGKIGEGKYDEYPSYPERLKKGNPALKTAYLYNWDEDALIRTGADIVFRPSDEDGAVRDAKLIDKATEILRGEIDSLTLYLDSMDMYGHGKGFSPFVDEYYNKMTEYDAAIGKLLSAVRNRPEFKKESWQIILVSDHGGLGTSHGIKDCENCYTIPIIVASKDGARGRMKNQPLNCCVAAYVMQHMTGAVPADFDGKICETYSDHTAEASDAEIVYRQPENTEHYAEKIGSPEALEFGADQDFSITLWFRTNQPQQGDPVLIGNKDWTSGMNPGLVLAANTNDQDGNQLWLNLSDGTIRDDLRPLAYQPDGTWWFIAVSAERKGNATLYLVRSDGRISFISDDISNLGDITSKLSWNIGSDGTGDYRYRLNGEIRGLTIRNRAISPEEVKIWSTKSPSDS